MLHNTQITKTPSVNRLVRIWQGFYKIDLFSLKSSNPSINHAELMRSASSSGRKITSQKLHDILLDKNRELSVVQAQTFYEYLPTIFDLNESRRLAEGTFNVYLKLIEFYQQPFYQEHSEIDKGSSAYQERGFINLGIPNIVQLAQMINPTLLEFQQVLIDSKDWYALGFITTHFKFANKLLLDYLPEIEKILLAPYFEFVEHQVAVPWQRVCAAAASHGADSKALQIVEKIMPQAPQLAYQVYEQLVTRFPKYQGRRGGLYHKRGGLCHPGVAHSSLRDLNMFQAYFWLSVLQGSLTPIEDELVPLCMMVIQNIGVTWELTEAWIEFLLDHIFQQVTGEKKVLLKPYAEGLKAAFDAQKQELDATA